MNICDIMDRKKQFESEKENITGGLSHIAEQIDSPELCGIDRLYGEADALSLKNAQKHRRVLMELSAVGTLLTLFFLLYDEAELYGLIFACGAMILSLFLIRYIADRSQCHRKYLEYRVLAESLRVQYYLFLTGNYYGKMSLPNIIDDHKRMIALYGSVEEKFRAEGESSETILDLARECLNENATWYAYQNKNKPDLVI